MNEVIKTCYYCSQNGVCEYWTKHDRQHPKLTEYFGGGPAVIVEPGVISRQIISCLPFALAPTHDRVLPIQKVMCEGFEA